MVGPGAPCRCTVAASNGRFVSLTQKGWLRVQDVFWRGFQIGCGNSRTTLEEDLINKVLLYLQCQHANGHRVIAHEDIEQLAAGGRQTFRPGVFQVGSICAFQLEVS